jgi:hypothetical protein
MRLFFFAADNHRLLKFSAVFIAGCLEGAHWCNGTMVTAVGITPVSRLTGRCGFKCLLGGSFRFPSVSCIHSIPDRSADQAAGKRTTNDPGAAAS